MSVRREARENSHARCVFLAREHLYLTKMELRNNFIGI
jgi:hypothetical protein